MTIQIVNDHKIDVPADMEIRRAGKSPAGDFDCIVYRGAAITTLETEGEELYAGPFHVFHQEFDDEVEDLAAARTCIDQHLGDRPTLPDTTDEFEWRKIPDGEDLS